MSVIYSLEYELVSGTKRIQEYEDVVRRDEEAEKLTAVGYTVKKRDFFKLVPNRPWWKFW
jgi:hypothetical protein